VSTRPLRILYFDGASGTKLKSGSVDTQNFLAWGHIGNQTVFEEPALLNGLCEWGKAFNIDGYVRMEMSLYVLPI
jgi:methionine synthase I (cobalamin-dependent)